MPDGLDGLRLLSKTAVKKKDLAEFWSHPTTGQVTEQEIEEDVNDAEDAPVAASPAGVPPTNPESN